MNSSFRDLLSSLDPAQLRELATEMTNLASARQEAATTPEVPAGIDLMDITPDRMRDPQFAAQVRAELNAVLNSIL